MPNKLRILLTLAFILLILLSSLIPMHENLRSSSLLLGLESAMQNLLHVPAFAVLTILCLQVLSYFTVDRTRKVILALGFAVALGALSELVQMSVPGRSPDIVDIMLNFLSSVLGLGLYMVAERRHSGLLRRVVCG